MSGLQPDDKGSIPLVSTKDKEAGVVLMVSMSVFQTEGIGSSPIIRSNINKGGFNYEDRRHEAV